MRYKTVLHKKFANILNRTMNANRIDIDGLAWFVECHPSTAKGWVKGQYFPSRNYALVLSAFDDELARFFKQLARVDQAQRRWDDRRQLRKAG